MPARCWKEDLKPGQDVIDLGVNVASPISILVRQRSKPSLWIICEFPPHLYVLDIVKVFVLLAQCPNQHGSSPMQRLGDKVDGRGYEQLWLRHSNSVGFPNDWLTFKDATVGSPSCPGSKAQPPSVMIISTAATTSCPGLELGRDARLRPKDMQSSLNCYGSLLLLLALNSRAIF